ncbi:Hsp20/alpha crystallin family protein [Staphylococcus pettenkoferi]|uniref:Hsp20/alpha crystallin family protein n=1 Tax=Staphylococcus pettenkoferi TaxID=170573 RepID=UPI00066CE012|nr:Hsp20/alpha crystallin family protein [Staphylococcus pettenkoferi]MCI2802570.1 Hsp20/alpha crystallin family protein [Staphylococcus pettenkoferi]MCY1574143.1 Hsp20/alpha crystallin family protein [Staphylococcus pettenkoferi]MCY1577706.1 Hsp20/alpha crystallin family protein [Staphylococcus pettenkoferi]MCY1584993.1 Hsp20/alpha crystallin family protein [Staphylococcus pettenkoferi]MCY1616253.1 Hsp20/alpha crystallin family protein [Staphylococcus pettenkoferi]
MEQTRRRHLPTDFIQGLFPRTIKSDVHETEDNYIVTAELPGINKEDIDIDYEDNVLTIIASQEDDSNDDAHYHVKERHITDMNRQFIFKNIDSKAIKAQYTNGLLKVTLPKQQTKTKITID